MAPWHRRRAVLFRKRAASHRDAHVLTHGSCMRLLALAGDVTTVRHGRQRPCCLGHPQPLHLRTRREDLSSPEDAEGSLLPQAHPEVRQVPCTSAATLLTPPGTRSQEHVEQRHLRGVHVGGGGCHKEDEHEGRGGSAVGACVCTVTCASCFSVVLGEE